MNFQHSVWEYVEVWREERKEEMLQLYYNVSKVSFSNYVEPQCGYDVEG